jgi:hypothetical protein
MASETLNGLKVAILIEDGFEQVEMVLDACCAAWIALVEEPQRIASIATRDWTSVIPYCRWY